MMSDQDEGRVRVAGPAEVPAAVATLAEAFDADPVWGWAFDDAARRRAQHEAWFDLLVRQAVANRSAWLTPGGEAVAIWVPPGRPELDADRERRLVAMIEERCGARAGLILAAFELFDANHPNDREHWYLSLLATGDRHRGHGHGMRLLAANLATLDAAGRPAYLESTNPANLKRYAAVGFEPIGRFSLPLGGPEVTTMWREPRRTLTRLRP